MTASNEQSVRRRYEVRGHVQAVGFRAWTVRQAQALRLRGTVCNLPVGTVEVEAAGPREALDQFASLLREGPRYADVREVREVQPGATPLPPGFIVKY